MQGWKQQVAALAVALITAQANAEIYRWVDAQGITHYSDNPPDQHNSQPIDDALPPVHRMQRPDAQLTQLQQQAQQQRAAGTAVANRPRRSPSNSASARCERWQRQLDKLQMQLRRGYSEPRGNKLRQRRRELKALYNSNCR